MCIRDSGTALWCASYLERPEIGLLTTPRLYLERRRFPQRPHGLVGAGSLGLFDDCPLVGLRCPGLPLLTGDRKRGVFLHFQGQDVLAHAGGTDGVGLGLSDGLGMISQPVQGLLQRLVGDCGGGAAPVSYTHLTLPTSDL